MARLHFVDGAETIGGTKLLLEDAGTRLLFDFGSNFTAEGAYFAYDPQLKKYAFAFERRFSQMRALGLLPDLPGAPDAYFPGFVKTDHDHDQLADPGIQGVFLTHAHHDHDGNVPFLSPQIPLYGTPETLCFYAQKWINDYVGRDGYPRNHYANNEHWRKRTPGAGLVPLTGGEPVEVGRTRVTPIRVDHSIPGACGFLVETSGGRQLALTGDLRLHGTRERQDLTLGFIDELARRELDLLVSEGTNIDEYSSQREEASGGGWSVKEFIKTEVALAHQRGGMVFVGVSGNNIERIDSIYEVVRELGARLHLSVYNASVLERLRATGAPWGREHVCQRLLDTDHVAIYERYEDELARKFVGEIDRPYARHPVADYAKSRGGLREGAVMLLYEGDLGLLTTIRPPAGSKYIRSSWEPFNDEQKPDFSRLQAWLAHFGVSYHHIHASGHIYGPQLKQAIAKINPGVLVPIHTEKPELFSDVLPGDRVKLVKCGESLQV